MHIYSLLLNTLKLNELTFLNEIKFIIIFP